MNERLRCANWTTASSGSRAWKRIVLVLFLALPAALSRCQGAEVPSSPFLSVVYRYADAMLQNGRDTYGPQKSGLFPSALDREGVKPLTVRPPAPAGVREGDRVGVAPGPLVGANPQHDENLLRVLYTLSGLSGQSGYRDAADTELRWFLENARSPATHLLPWGEHMSWNVLTDKPIPDQGNTTVPARHEFSRPWMLWDRCFELAPEASKQFALGLWEHQIADQKTGAFDRHADFYKHAPKDGMDFARHAGFYIRTWAAACRHTKDERMLEAIEALLGRFERKRHPRTGLIELCSGRPQASPLLTLSLAIDCHVASLHVPEPLASRLRAFVAREDEVFCKLPHDLEGRGGFVTALDRETGKPLRGCTPLWQAGYGTYTTAQVAMMCVSRYENSGKIGYRELIRAAADAYLNSMPEAEIDVWPMTYGHAISLELAAWRSTARPVYLESARKLATKAVETFWQDNPLPQASSKTGHYESITGADTLALSLVELHLSILHITAVRCPSNTIDR
jgi:hypothetical protein